MARLLELTDDHAYAIGKEVRVVSNGKGTSSRRGMISYVNEDDTFDIMFQTHNNRDEEESTVKKDHIFDILPFEVYPLSSLDEPSVIKDYANQLFQLQDYDTAYHYYIRAHKLIQQYGKSFNIGQRLIISLPPKNTNDQTLKRSDPSQKQRSGLYICVTISDVIHAGEVDVMYDEEWESVDEEEGVPESRVLLVVAKDTGTPNTHIDHTCIL